MGVNVVAVNPRREVLHVAASANFGRNVVQRQHRVFALARAFEATRAGAGHPAALEPIEVESLPERGGDPVRWAAAAERGRELGGAWISRVGAEHGLRVSRRLEAGVREDP